MDDLENPSTDMSAVNTLRQMEQRRMTQPSGNPSSIVPENTPPSRMSKFTAWLPAGKLGNAFKVLFLGVVAVFGLLALYALSLLTSIDTTIIKLTLVGQVIDQAEKPVENAVVTMAGNSARTDEGGRFTFTNLDLARYTIKITANGYLERDQEISLSRGFFNYTNYRQFQIQSAEEGSITGQLKAKGQNYLFLDEQVRVGDQGYPVQADGKFTISKINIGSYKLIVDSQNFKDTEIEFEVKPGINKLNEIELTPAGDVTGNLKSWVREDVVSDVIISVEGVVAARISKEGETFTIRDLDVGRSYTIRSQADGYQTRDYKIEIKQGENQLFDFKIVESGFIPFIRKIDDNNQIIATHLDGKNEIQLTDGRTEPFGEFTEKNEVYYLSTRDNISNNIGGKALVTYVASTRGGFPQRLMQDTSDLGQVTPNWYAKKLINLREGSTQDARIVEIMDLRGQNRVKVGETADGTFTDVVLSDDGKFVYYYQQDKQELKDGLYRVDTAGGNPRFLLNKKNLQIYDVNRSGNLLLYSATSAATGLADLFIYNHTTGQDTTLRRSFSGSQYQFVNNSDNLLLFHDFRDGGNNVFLLDIKQNKEIALTKFSGVEGIEAIYQQGEFLLYQTNKAIYIMDVLKPHTGKLITSNFVRYTGYDF